MADTASLAAAVHLVSAPCAASPAACNDAACASGLCHTELGQADAAVAAAGWKQVRQRMYSPDYGRCHGRC